MKDIKIKTSINGVFIVSLKVNEDFRGNFIEVLRKDWGVLNKIAQVSLSTTKTGIIKAFHMHKRQSEIWHLLDGKVHVVLYDKRKDSKTYGRILQISIDSKKYKKIIFIPSGVAHGYKVLGRTPARMLYVADKEYNPKDPDEIRIDPYDSLIGIKWGGIR